MINWCILVCATAGLALAPVPQESVDKNGWDLKAWVTNLSPSIIPGEYFSSIRIKVRLQNRSADPRAYLPLDKARMNGDLEVTITPRDGHYMRAHLELVPNRTAKKLTMVPEAMTEAEFSLGDFGYDYEIRRPGKYYIDVTLTTPDGKATASPIEFEAVDVPEKAILSSVPIPLGGFYAKQLENEREKVFIQQLKIGDEFYLYYRRFVGSKYGGGVAHATRLATFKEKTTFDATGVYDSGKSIDIVYSHKPGGKTYLTVASLEGTIKKRVVVEEESRK